ncbi:hypothetical protein GCM10029963_52850 [Micromonospora andamanensis]
MPNWLAASVTVRPPGTSATRCSNRRPRSNVCDASPPGIDPPGIDPPGIDPPGIDPPGIDPPGIDPPGTGRSGIDRSRTDPPGDGRSGIDGPGGGPSGTGPTGSADGGVAPGGGGVLTNSSVRAPGWPSAGAERQGATRLRPTRQQRTATLVR